MEHFRNFWEIFKQSIRLIGAWIIHGIGRSFLWQCRRLYDLIVDAGLETGILAFSLMVNINLHPFERILWLVIIIVSILGAFVLSNLQYNRYLNSPTVMSVDRDYRGWSGLFPAVTLCYYDHVDTFKANEYIEENWNVSIVDEDYFYFMDFLYAVVNATANDYSHLARFAEDTRFDRLDLLDVIQRIDRPYEQVLAGYEETFELQVMSVMTERGLCYAINSPIAEILSGRSLTFDELQPPLVCQYGNQHCYIKMDLYESTGNIAIHSPYEVSTSSDANVIALHYSDEVIASYKVLETVGSKNLRDLSAEQRKCVFHDEETSQLKVYSKTLCLARCRAVMALEMCNCVPFFYTFVDGPKCNPAGFECLLDFKWPIWALHICKCPNTCTETEYTVQTVKKSSWGVKSSDDNLKSDIATSSFRWDLIPPKMRLRRDVVFSFEDLLVSFGGTLALFLGFSLLSVTTLGYILIFYTLEIIYEAMKFILMKLTRLLDFSIRIGHSEVSLDVNSTEEIIDDTNSDVTAEVF